MSIKNHITWDCVVKIIPATWLGTKMGQLRKVEGDMWYGVYVQQIRATYGKRKCRKIVIYTSL